MVRSRKKDKKNSKTRRIDRARFPSLVVLWIIMTLLCYFGVVAFDSKSLDGAIATGLILSVSIVGAIEFLKIMYDDGVKLFRKRK